MTSRVDPNDDDGSFDRASLTELASYGWYRVLDLFAFARDEMEVVKLRRIGADYRHALDLMKGAPPRKPKTQRVQLLIHPRPVSTTRRAGQ